MSRNRHKRRKIYGGEELLYLLRDEFHSPLAAGSVNGTDAEPGPGTRVVTDAENKISIAGGVLTCAGGKVIPAWGDPAYWLDAVARIAGRALITEVTFTNIGGNVRIGYDDDQAAHPQWTFLFSHGIISTLNAGVPTAVGAFAAATYKLVIVMRASGLFYFIKGGAFTEWTLLYTFATSATSPLYPANSCRDIAGAYTDDYFRIPQELWLPRPLLSDSFNRANGALGITDQEGHAEANGGGGRAWINRVGTTQIATNAASASALVGGIAVATVDVGNIDVLHEAETTRSAGNVGIVLRYADADNYVYAIHDGTNAKLIKRVATAETDVISAVTAYAAGAVMRVICDGTGFSLFYNNVRIGATETIADAGLQTGTEAGVYSSDTGNSQDDCVIWSRKTGYNELDKF